MDVTYVIAGSIRREYILPPVGPPLLDAPGGSALYACGGLLTWQKQVGLLARIGEDFPKAWLAPLERQGVDTAGIKILPGSADLRTFLSYDEKFAMNRNSPVSQFAKRKLPFPKGLLGYQAPVDTAGDTRRMGELSPTPADIPPHYGEARAVHLCPLGLEVQTRLATTFRGFGVASITVEPSAAYMEPSFLQAIRPLLNMTTAFLPSEAKLRSLFWGQTYDIWEMMIEIGACGCEIVVVQRADGSQALYDARGDHRWEVPAYPSRAADPTGTGDAYAGGFLAGYKSTYDPLQAALHGNVAASIKLEGSGAFYGGTVLEGLADARLRALQELVRQV